VFIPISCASGGLTVAEFYQNIFADLAALGVDVEIRAVPYEAGSEEPFPTDTQHAAYDIKHRVGAGEAATILLAKELTAAVALVDERRARRLATAEAVPVSGSIAVLESGHRRGELKDLRRTYLELLAAGIRVGRPVLNRSRPPLGSRHSEGDAGQAETDRSGRIRGSVAKI